MKCAQPLRTCCTPANLLALSGKMEKPENRRWMLPLESRPINGCFVPETGVSVSFDRAERNAVHELPAEYERRRSKHVSQQRSHRHHSGQDIQNHEGTAD